MSTENDTPQEAAKPRKARGFIWKTVSFALGWGTLVRTVGTAKAMLWNTPAQWGYETTRESLRHLAGSKSDADAKRESFEEACERLELSEEDLIARREDLIFQGKVFRVVGYISLLAGLVAAFNSATFFWYLLLTLNTLCVTTMFFGIAFARFFRAWQVEERKLDSIASFIKAGGVFRTLI